MGNPKIIYSFDNYVTYPLCNKICPHIKYLNITPNQISFCRIIPSIIASYMFYYNYIFISTIFIIITIFMDCLDGAYARKYKLFSKYGHQIDMGMDILCSFIFIFQLIIKYNLYYTNIMYVLFLLLLFNNLLIKIKTPRMIKYLQNIITDNSIIIIITMYILFIYF